VPRVRFKRHYRALLRKMSYKDTAPYEPSPPCISVYVMLIRARGAKMCLERALLRIQCTGKTWNQHSSELTFDNFHLAAPRVQEGYFEKSATRFTTYNNYTADWSEFQPGSARSTRCLVSGCSCACVCVCVCVCACVYDITESYGSRDSSTCEHRAVCCVAPVRMHTAAEFICYSRFMSHVTRRTLNHRKNHSRMWV